MTDRDFRQAFGDHKDAAYGFALRMTGSAAAAEDIAQDCFLELLRHPEWFDSRQVSLRAFLLGVARNLALRRWRREHRLDPLDIELEGPTPDFVGNDAVELVAAAVQSLPPLQREAIVLFEYEGFTLEEIARIAEADVGTVKSRLHRARERLRRILAPLHTGAGGTDDRR
jgi:RNA polymerase sigma-70 factor (ECF subfamily)